MPVSARTGLVVLAVVVAPFLALGLYLWIMLSWSYSDGERAGILQKFSRKGWVCKTHEGELAMYVVPGVAPTIWPFTVRDEAVARQVTAAIGKKVVLHYEEHRGIPTTCFGDTSQFVTAVRVTE